MRLVYELIGRIVVGFVRLRYGRQLQVAGAVVAALVALAAYLLASGEAEEA